ncbi:transglutaminase [Intrasporangium oryzae NRRL B-24470]|uniref:Transglutaminase n=1 Tax=Intrasporangium oryzae NRRL B-24470 TaxID=1386089 RepID=W9GAW5_9MICO|nr:DUF3488 and transglutaminase-like domain-containing protein [Intrasporangium oryzae]EWT03205.1 transglutaminase [Intrasporangium oryzae NRRL B-24470]
MTRRRWRITLLGAAATLAAIYPISSLFNRNDWLVPVIAVISLVAAVGLVMRGLTRVRPLIPLVQVVVVGYAILWSYAGDTFSFLLPTGATLEVANSLGLQALETVQRYTVPAPLNDGVTFCLVIAVALVAICVDAMAATWRSPAAAGLPLLTAYLITAANGQSALALRYFIVPVALWLIMLHTTARAQFGRWGTMATAEAGRAHPEPDPGRDPAFRTGLDAIGLEAAHDREALRSFSVGAVRLGLIALLLAVAVPAVIPHFPPRYLLEGLGRGSGGEGKGSVGFNDTVDLTRSLNNNDQTPVLTYTTTAFTRSPLRVLATSYYSQGRWLVLGEAANRVGQPQPLPPSSERRDYVLDVTGNLLAAPRIAVPYPVVAVSMEGTPWSIDPITRDVRVGKSVANYRVTYADVSPTTAQLREAGQPDSPDITQDDLTIPDRSRDLIHRWSNQVTAGANNSLDKAIAIQDHLRDTSRYTYSLDLGPTVRDSTGRIAEPIQAFYETRRGYCVQFATAMIMLARAQGIPARMAIGFLPGSRSGDKYVVRSSDAHAWPELYFQGSGWLRFEPTPGSRSGAPPSYTIVGAESGPTGGGRAVTERGSIKPPIKTVAGPAERDVTTTPTDVSLLSRLSSVVSVRGVATTLAVLVGLLAAFIMPITAWVLRERRRRAARTRQDLLEVEWEDLTSHLRDLGIVGPAGSTLRQVRERFISEGHLDETTASAMRRVTTTLEKSRYDLPERTSRAEAEELQRDIRSIRRHVGATRTWSIRVRSFVWPEAGVSFWRSLAARVLRDR